LVVAVQGDAERDVEAWLRRKFEARIRSVEVVMREDLDLVRGEQAGHRRQQE
jgi:BMFP domain-containing protein YqiC